jgi:hypothetical protein
MGALRYRRLPGQAPAGRGAPAEHGSGTTGQSSDQTDQKGRKHVHAGAGFSQVGLGSRLGGDGTEGAVPCQGALQLRLVQPLALGSQPMLGDALLAALVAQLEVALQLRLVRAAYAWTAGRPRSVSDVIRGTTAVKVMPRPVRVASSWAYSVMKRWVALAPA